MSRILHILSQLPSKTGSGVFLDNLLEQSHWANHEQGLVLGLPQSYAYEPPEYLACFSPVYFETDALPFKIPGMSDVMPYDSTKFSELSPENWKAYLLAFEKAIAWAIDQFKPDVILSNHLWAVTAVAVKVSHRQSFNRPKVYGVSHGTDLRQMELAPYLKTFIVENCQALDGVFCLHQKQFQQIQSLYALPGEKLSLIGNGYNAKVFHRCKREFRDPLNLIYAGKLSFSKGVLELIDAVNDLNEKFILGQSTRLSSSFPLQVRLQIAGKGSGSEERAILQAIEASPYTDCLGFLNQGALATAFYHSDLFVLPSYYEGLPLVVLEALATGLPVVVTDLPGLKTWLEGPINASGYITYVPLPELEGVDQCKKAAREPFVKALTAALEFSIEKIISQTYTADFPYPSIEEQAWENVFKLIALEMGL